MSNKYKLFSLFFIIPFMLVPVIAVAPTVKITSFWDKTTVPNYIDMKNFEWAAEAVGSLSKYGILNGYIEDEKNYFKANHFTTRAEFAKIIVSAFGFYNSSAKNDMLDNPDYWWAYRYIGSAVNAKIANGYSNEWFGSKDNILRQDVAVMLVNAINKAGMKLQKTKNYVAFEDDPELSDYAQAAVKTLQEAGIVQGDKFNRFYPKNNAERAEIAVMIYRVLNNVQN